MNKVNNWPNVSGGDVGPSSGDWRHSSAMRGRTRPRTTADNCAWQRRLKTIKLIIIYQQTATLTALNLKLQLRSRNSANTHEQLISSLGHRFRLPTTN